MNRFVTSLLLAAVPFITAVADSATVVSSSGFEAGIPSDLIASGSSAVVTSAPEEVVAGARSLKGDSRQSTTEWNEFFHSRVGLFKAGEAYTIAFDYKILARQGDATFYTLLRRQSAASSSAGWQDLKSAPGETGHVETSFATRTADDYYLIVGIHNKGAIAIDNLVIKSDPAHRPTIAKTPGPERTWKSPGQALYYIDSVAGSNSADGRSPKSAWKTLDRINAGEFASGDRIRLKRGSAWAGFLSPGGSGSERSPIVVESYGRGAQPKIDAKGLWLSTILLHNSQQIEVRDLDIANTSADRQPKLSGVAVTLQDFGDARHIVLDGLTIHDVHGSLVKDEGGGNGITCSCGGDKVKTRFDGLTIQNCRLTRTDRNGITMGGNWVRDHWYPSLHVVIRGNQLEDIGGDGIVPIGCDGALVEHNVIHGGRMRCDDYAAGIWPWSCDNTVVQYNEVSGMHGTKDGQGYDCDYNCQNTLFQYNYSHDNDGGFMLICTDGGQHLPWNIGNIGSVIRYNVSANDGLHTFTITGPCKDTQIYNNSFYVGKGREVKLVDAGNWGGTWSDNTVFTNNIFKIDGKASFGFGGMTNTQFRNNAFSGTIANRPDDAHPILTDPNFVNAGQARNGMKSAGDYRLKAGSPCIGAGVTVPLDGGRDFWGKPIPKTSPNIGADQSHTDR
jgi:hypothetical protein